MSDHWLFDAYPHPRSSHIVLWIKQGRTVVKRLEPYHPTFCIKAEASPLSVAERILSDDPRVDSFWRDTQVLWLRGDPGPVLRVRPKRLQDLHAVATDLRRATHSKGFLFFDVDHQSESRFLHERGLFPMCRLKPDRLELAEGEDRWMLEHPDPGLVTLRLGLEVEKKGHVASFEDPLVEVRLGDQSFTCEKPGDPHEEAATLLAFADHLQDTDPDVLTTRHGDRFDVPFLLHRIRQLGLAGQVRLGRDVDPHPEHPDQEGKSMHTYGRWLYKTSAYYLRGRWHIDLSKKSLDSEDDRKDLWGILYLARSSNRRPQDINRNGAGYALQQMQIDHALDLGSALPWKRNLAEDWKDVATLCAVDRGGQIVNPEPGIYEDVAACDFSGYYPSLVVEHNLSSDTLNCRCCPDGPVIPELGYHVCTKVQGHQAAILAKLVPHRRYVKAMLRQAK